MARKAEFVEKQFSNFNCCQTVLSLFADELGLEKDTALKIASGFGSGMACAETCGAVTGAYMVIGMKHGHVTPDPEKKANTKQKILKFNEAFIKVYGNLKCKNLTGFDISTEEGLKAAREKDVFNTRCPDFIKTACDLLEDEF